MSKQLENSSPRQHESGSSKDKRMITNEIFLKQDSRNLQNNNESSFLDSSKFESSQINQSIAQSSMPTFQISFQNTLINTSQQQRNQDQICKMMKRSDQEPSPSKDEKATGQMFNQDQSTEKVLSFEITIANSFIQQGKIKAAIQILLKILKHFQQNSTIKSRQRVENLSSLGQAFKKERNYIKARQHYENACRFAQEIYSKSQNKDHQKKLGKAFMNLARVQAKLKQNKKALNIYKKVEQIFLSNQITPESDDTLFEDLYQGFAFAYKKCENADKAIQYFEKTLKIKDKRKDFQKDKSYASILLYIGYTYFKNSEFTLALQRMKQAFQLQTKYFPEPHEVAKICAFRARIYDSLAKYDEAIEQFDKSIKFYTESYGQEHTTTIKIKVIRSLTYLKIEKSEKSINQAQQIYQKAINFFREPPKQGQQDSQIHLALTLRCRGSLQLLRKQTSKAIEYFDEALKIYRIKPHLKPVQYAITLNQKGNALRQNKKYDEAISQYESAYKIYKDQKIDRLVHSGKLFYDIARLEHMRNNQSQALKNIRQAIEIMQQKYPQQHPLLVDARKLMKLIKTELQKQNQ